MKINTPRNKKYWKRRLGVIGTTAYYHHFDLRPISNLDDEGFTKLAKLFFSAGDIENIEAKMLLLKKQAAWLQFYCKLSTLYFLKMNLFILATAQLNDHLLKDGTWQKADFYDLSTGSTFWNRAGIITLPKIYTQTPATALIYLLQKETRALKIWERNWADTIPTVQDFIHFFLAERGFTNAEGQLTTIESFWEKYSASIAGITTAPGFVFSKNEIAEPFTNLLNKEEIIQVTCFDDTWDEQNFFIETETAWVLFHWGSAA